MTDAPASSSVADTITYKPPNGNNGTGIGAARRQNRQAVQQTSGVGNVTTLDAPANTDGSPATSGSGPNNAPLRPPRRRQPNASRGPAEVPQSGSQLAYPAASQQYTNGDSFAPYHQQNGHSSSSGAGLPPPPGLRPNSRRQIRDPGSLSATPIPAIAPVDHLAAASDHTRQAPQQQQQQPPVDRFASSRYEYQRPSLPQSHRNGNSASNQQNHVGQVNSTGYASAPGSSTAPTDGLNSPSGQQRGPRAPRPPSSLQQRQQRQPPSTQQQQQQQQAATSSNQQPQHQPGSSGGNINQTYQRPLRPRSGAAANGGGPPPPPTKSPRQPSDRTKVPTRGMQDSNYTSSAANGMQQPSAPPHGKPLHSHRSTLPQPLPSFTCLICCEPSHTIAIGKCGHTDVCAMCTLRLRMLYSDNRCSLCKGQNEEVIIISAPATPVSLDSSDSSAPAPSNPSSSADGSAVLSACAVLPTFESLVALRSRMWQKPGWAKGVLVDDASGLAAGDALQARPEQRVQPQDLLHSKIVAATTRSCSICSEKGYSKLFPSDKQMQDHLQTSHGMQCCSICLTAGRRFPLELPPLSPADLQQHVHSAHESCAFCRLDLYGKDELYAHMTQHHFTCHVCQRLGAQHLYFQDADMLAVHLATQHFLCSEQECNGCFIAFATEDELRTHCTQRHSVHMPRWDQSRARPLIFDFVTPAARALAISASRSSGDVRGSASNTSNMNNSSSTRSRRRGNAGGDNNTNSVTATISAMAAAATSAAANATAAAATHSRGLGENYESADGMGMIDDDLGSFAAAAAGAAELAAVAANEAYGAASRELTGAWASRANGPAEEFPSLQAAATAPTQSLAPSALASMQASWTRPVLRKATLRCPCGRIVAHLGLRDGEEETPPECNRECATAARRGQLASAFGVDDPNSHVSSFERHRMPAYSAKLQEAALDRPTWVEGLESEFTNFLMDASKKRHSLAPMSATQRALAHELAEAYGLTSHSTGQEPNKCVQVFKTPQSGTPSKSVVAVANATGRDGLSSIQGPARSSFSLRLVDLSPDVNLQFYLRTWAGDYEVAWQSSTTALITFNNAVTFKSASDSLAGGIRGIFRVDRSLPQQTPPPSSAPGWATIAPPASSRAATISTHHSAGAFATSSSTRGGGDGTADETDSSAPVAGWQVWSKSKGKGRAPAAVSETDSAITTLNGATTAKFLANGASGKASHITAVTVASGDPWDDADEKAPAVASSTAPWRRSSGRVPPPVGGPSQAAGPLFRQVDSSPVGELEVSGLSLVSRPLAVPADWSDSEEGDQEIVQLAVQPSVE